MTKNTKKIFPIKDIELKWLIFLIFLLIILFLSSNYIYGHSDHYEQLPIIKRMMDSAYLKNDWFVNQNMGFTVRYYFSNLMAFLGIFLGLPVAYFLIYLIVFIATITATCLISYQLFKNKLTSFLSSFLIMFAVKTTLGRNWIIKNLLIPSFIAHALALFAIYFFMKKRYYLCFIILGIATLFHLLIGMFISSILLLYMLITIKRKEVKTFFGSICCYISFALWNIVPSFFFLNSTTAGLEIMKIIGHIRHPWHYMPFQFSIIDYFLFTAVLFLFILSLKYKPRREEHKFVMFFVYIVILLFLLGVFFVEILPIPIILKLQPFRLISYLVFFAYIYIANYFRINFYESRSVSDFLIKFGQVMSFLISYLLLAFTIFYIFYEKILKKNDIKPLHIDGIKSEMVVLITLFVLSLSILYIFFPLHLSNFFNIASKQFTPLLVIFSLILLTLIIRENMKNKIKVNQLLVAIIIISTFSCSYVLIDTNIHNYDNEERSEVYEWIQINTPKDAVFVIPPHIEDFRLGADRAVFIDFKAFPFNGKSIIEWKKRITLVTNNISFKFRGNRIQELERGFNSLNESVFMEIGKKYAVKYILIEKPKKVDFEVVYENGKYVIYSLPL